MKTRRANSGFSLIEAMIALILIGMVLAVVVSCYEKVSRINLATGAYSDRLELLTSIQVLTSEISGASSISIPQTDQLQLVRVDPTLNRQATEARGRLPWPWPAAGSIPDPAPAAFLDPNRQPFTVSWNYAWVSVSANSGQLIKTVRPIGTNPTAVRQVLSLNHVKSVSFFRDPNHPKQITITVAPESGNPIAVDAYLWMAP